MIPEYDWHLCINLFISHQPENFSLAPEQLFPNPLRLLLLSRGLTIESVGLALNCLEWFHFSLLFTLLDLTFTCLTVIYY